MSSRSPDDRSTETDVSRPLRTRPLPREFPGAHFIGSEEMRLVSEVLEARSPFRFYGPDLRHMVVRLEKVFRQRLGRRFSLGVNSGTSALYLALSALGVGPGDEVLVPGYLWVSCLGAVVRAGAVPRLVDIDDTFFMDPDDLRRKITPRSKVVLLIHMSGAPGKLDQCMSIARQAGLKAVEDCAQANGAMFNGRPVGSFGDLATFSFQLNKNMTCGEGGMVVCDDEDLFRRCMAVHDVGYSRNEQGRLNPADERYQFWGIGGRMSELAAAMALAQVAKLDSIVESMRVAKWTIRRQLAEITGLEFRHIVDPAGDSGPFLITIYPSADICQRFTEHLVADGINGGPGSMTCITMRQWGLHWYFNNTSLTRRRGVCPNGWPWTDPANAFAETYRYERGALPVCDDLAERSALLAIASRLAQEDIHDIVTAFARAAAAVGL